MLVQSAKVPGVQRMLRENEDAVLHRLVPVSAQVKTKSDGGVTLDVFVACLDKAGLLRNLSIQLDVWKSVVDYGQRKGDYFRKAFKSAIRSEDVKQARSLLGHLALLGASPKC